MWRTQSGDIGRAVAKGGSQKDGEFSLFAVDPNGEDALKLEKEAKMPDSTVLANEPIFSLVAGQDLGSRAWVKGECSPSLADELERIGKHAPHLKYGFVDLVPYVYFRVLFRFCFPRVSSAGAVPVKVAVIDTGVDKEFFDTKFPSSINLKCFDLTKGVGENAISDWKRELGADQAVDLDGHGTHIASIIAQLAGTH